MPRESKRSKRERATEICRRMGELYPGVKSALTFANPFELVICVLLSAQTTDAGVNRVTPELFARWPDAQSMATADPEEVGEVIHSIGFWRAKSKHCVETAQMIVFDFGGEVPGTMEELCRLPGVGKDRQHRAEQGIWRGRWHCGGHPRVSPGNALWAHPRNDAGGCREGPSRRDSTRAVVQRQRGVDPLWARRMHGTLAQVRRMSHGRHLSERRPA